MRSRAGIFRNARLIGERRFFWIFFFLARAFFFGRDSDERVNGNMRSLSEGLFCIVGG